MAETFNGILTTYANAALTTTPTLAFAAGGSTRAGVIIANNSTAGAGDLLIMLQEDFTNAPGSMANPTLKVSPGNSVQIGANKGIAIWLASSTSTIVVKVTPVQN